MTVIDETAAKRIATALGWAPKREWVGLTEHERMMCRSYDVDEAIEKTEAKLKEKNT